MDSFWQRWNRDVLQALVTRKAWNTEKRNVELDDLVVMADNNAIHGRWTIGRVIDVYPGTDGQVCNVKVNSPAEIQPPSHKDSCYIPC